MCADGQPGSITSSQVTNAVRGVVSGRARGATVQPITTTTAVGTLAILARPLMVPVLSRPMAPPSTSDPIEWIRRDWPAGALGDPRKFLAMGSVLRLHQLVANAMDQEVDT
jgi:hypothetical protein